MALVVEKQMLRTIKFFENYSRKIKVPIRPSRAVDIISQRYSPVIDRLSHKIQKKASLPESVGRFHEITI